MANTTSFIEIGRKTFKVENYTSPPVVPQFSIKNQHPPFLERNEIEHLHTIQTRIDAGEPVHESELGSPEIIHFDPRYTRYMRPVNGGVISVTEEEYKRFKAMESGRITGITGA